MVLVPGSILIRNVMSKIQFQKLEHCISCRLPMNLCVCELLPKFNLQTRIVVLMQRSEFNFITNSGRFIPQILRNSDMRFRGRRDQIPLNTDGMIPKDTQPYILFPANNAPPLTQNFINNVKKPMTLIIPDGKWRQSVKILKKNCFPPSNT